MHTDFIKKISFLFKTYFKRVWPIALLALIVYSVQLLVIQQKIRAIFTFPDQPRFYVYGILALTGLFGFSFYFAFFSLCLAVLKNNLLVKKRLFYFLIYFVIMGIFLLLTWPGIFKGDEFYVLKSALEFTLSPAQTGITSIFYIVCLLFFPSMATTTFMQLILICSIFSYIMYHLIEQFQSRKIWFLMIPFLLLPVIDANLFTLRASLVAWLFLFILFKIYFLYKKNACTYKDILLLSALSGFLCAWRSEYIYLLLLIPVGLLFLKLVSKKNCLLFVIVFLCFFFVSNIPNKIAANGSNKYPISLVLNPLANLFTEEHLEGPSVYDDILVINELVDVQQLRKSASVRNISQYWNIPDVLPKDQLTRFMKSSLRIILYNPDLFLKYRFETFAYTNGLYPDRINHPGGEGVDSINKLIYYGTDYKQLFALSNPLLSQSLREKTISTLACRNYVQDQIKTTSFLPVFYNCIPTFVLLCLVLLFSIIRKKRIYIVLSILSIAQVFLIFLTAPAMFFMYYFCFYLSGYVLITLFLLEQFTAHTKKSQT